MKTHRWMPPEQRFWSRVAKSAGCWEWTGSVLVGVGYGRLMVNKRYVLAHRFSLQLAGVVVPDDKMVLHSCDNRRCVNPAHLRIGTAAENSQDMLERGRQGVFDRRGAKNGRAKVDRSQVDEIRRRCRAGEKQADVGAAFGLSQTTVSAIVRAETWP